MNSYQFCEDSTGRKVNVKRDDGWFIPFVMMNRHCRLFLSDWKSGATVSNADGSAAPYSDAAVKALGLTPV